MKSYPGVRKPPKPTVFKYPNGLSLRGVVIEEIYKRASYPGGDYLFVVQKIRLDSYKGKSSDVRIGYYRKEPGESKWRWGSQTTFQADKKTTEKLLQEAIKKNIITL